MLLLAAVSLASRVPANVGYYMQPTLRGNTLAFVSQGDLWTVPVTGGAARALTSHTAPVQNPQISPDGRTVAFTGTYEGNTEIYLLPLDGAPAKRLTYEGNFRAGGWTPKGQVIGRTSFRSTLPGTRLVQIDPTTLRETAVPLAQADEGVYDDSGKTLFFTRAPFQGSQTKRYKGGTAQGIWKFAEGAAEAVNLTASYPGTSKNPMYWKGRVYFLSDRDGWMNVWSMDPNGKDWRQVTRSHGWDLQSASLDQGRIAYQVGADLHVLDLETRIDREVPISLSSDFEASRERWIKNPLEYLTSFAPSPDGKRAVLTARGQIFVAPVGPGRLVEISRKASSRYRSAIFSPDGKSIFTLSDQTGETEWWKFPANGVGAGEQITSGSSVLAMGGVVSPDGKWIASWDKNMDLWLVDVAANTRTKIATSTMDAISDVSWSPDSKFLAFVLPTQPFGSLRLYNVETKKTIKATGDRSDVASPAWSPDGKWLYFLADRNFKTAVASPWGPRQPEPFFDRQTKIYALSLQAGTANPWVPGNETTPEPPKPATGPVKVTVDEAELVSRQIEVPVPAGNYRGLRATVNRLIVAEAPLGGAPRILGIEIKDEDVRPTPLIEGATGYELAADGKSILVQQGNGLISVPLTGAPPKPVDVSGWAFPIDPAEEWRQMYNEAWRLERDYFYDPKMHGVDWKAVREKYLPLVDRVRDRSELSNVLEQMVGELSALHTFVYGGDLRAPNVSVSTGYLGAQIERDSTSGGYRIEKIFQGDPDYPETLSPLVRPGVELKEGDIITSVNGQDVLAAPSLYSLLRNQVGKQVLLSVKGRKDVIVKPISNSAQRNLMYTDWERDRTAYVEKDSQGDIGYVHLRAMGTEDIESWTRDFYPQFMKSGLIIDVRHNNGGNIDSWIIEKLLRKAWFYWAGRVGEPTWNMHWAFRGHIAVLCDEETASDGEAFTEGIKRLKLGKVFGTRTWGGEIWLTSSNFLGDGGIATAAEFGVYGPEGKWLIEGHGVEPDVVVENLPHATYKGSDAQIDAALAYLKKKIKDEPVTVPAIPARPNKAFPPAKG